MLGRSDVSDEGELGGLRSLRGDLSLVRGLSLEAEDDETRL
jgi:hypothetical protein